MSQYGSLLDEIGDVTYVPRTVGTVRGTKYQIVRLNQFNTTKSSLAPLRWDSVGFLTGKRIFIVFLHTDDS